jgi:hypothetical protein
MKNIALMCFSTAVGGAESVVINIYNNLDRSKFNVHIITNDELKDEFNSKIGTVFSIGPMYKKPNKFIRVTRMIYHKLGINDRYLKLRIRKKKPVVEKYITENNIQVIHSHLQNDIYLLSILDIPNVFKVMTMHGAHGLDKKSGYDISAKDMAACFAGSDVITSACQYFLNLLSENISNLPDSFVIENGINFKVLEENTIPEIEDGKINMVFLGGAKAVKGWDILLNAVDIVVNNQGCSKK